MSKNQWLSRFIMLFAFAVATDYSIRFANAQQNYNEHTNNSEPLNVTIGRQGEHITYLDGLITKMDDDRKERRHEALEARALMQKDIDDINGRLHFDEGIGACAWAMIGIGQIVIYKKEKKPA